MLIIEGQKLRYPIMVDGGLNGRKGFEMQGEGFFDDLGRLVKRGVRAGVKQGKAFLPSLAKHLGPTVISVLASQGAKKAAEAGAPDFATNLISQAGQQAARAVQNAPGPKLSPNQAAVSGFINQQSDQLLQNLLSKRAGAGVRPLGGKGVRPLGGAARPLGDIKGYGIRRFGAGVRPLGKGVTEMEARKINR